MSIVESARGANYILISASPIKSSIMEQSEKTQLPIQVLHPFNR